MPRVSPAALSCLVTAMSSLLGMSPPVGWLWATMADVAIRETESVTQGAMEAFWADNRCHFLFIVTGNCAIGLRLELRALAYTLFASENQLASEWPPRQK